MSAIPPSQRIELCPAVRAIEERYRILFNSMDEGYCIIEMIFDERKKPVDYRFLEVNAAFEKQSGMPDVTGKRMLEFVSNIEEHWLANYGKVALTGEPIRFANEYKGLGSWFDVYAFRVGEPESLRVAVLFNNITERKRAETAARFLASIVDSSDDAIIGKSLDGIIQSWNPAAVRMFGYTAEQAVGHPITLIIPADRADEEVRILARLRAGERIITSTRYGCGATAGPSPFV